ncbi:anhydro-N-acetylmuramic acid kinase [Microbulbifer sp. CAU 1566]|uniref:anhydro-N-acetylmuramic acid kinase n=1 Tax=unclassified Microbulbifer TaxID=2619833 RepID=UPI00135A60FF|nr:MULTISPECIES: anhydro-N-acetylmuramic acid kinase [unclassified Microbulbifer]MCK7599082.1 anhydro-N-acetylmuramic acid kinase [Microbulbifer sp. CAU 1566]
MTDLYVGLMSGTSIDCIDAVLVEFSDSDGALHCKTVAALGHPINSEMRESILALCAPGPSELDRAGQLDRLLGQEFADATLAVLREAGVQPTAVTAIGSHGQTVRHRPPGSVSTPFSLQLGDPNTIAAVTGITTVADFRRRDMALGGQGAPLMPAFHNAVFRADRDRAVVNIGGMANITELSADGGVRGYDTGPGNALLDYWVKLHRGKAYDADGGWAASGRPHPELLNRLMADPFFSAPAPKSTGREAFNPSWLERACAGLELAPVDVQATLAEVTAASIADGVHEFAPGGELLICGGGARNQDLMERLRRRLPTWSVAATDQYGIDADWVEGAGFAWLARQTIMGLSGNCPAVTGAEKETILGGIFPA